MVAAFADGDLVRVAGRMGTMVAKAASGAWKVGTAAAADLLTAAVKSYYGLP
jgi:hypothetical protein